MRGGIVFIVLAIVLTSPALAQDVNESDFNTTVSDPDEAYLGDGAASGDPTVSENDFDTSVPTADESYLAEDAAGASAGSSSGTAGVPGPALGILLAALGVAALALRRPQG